nr:unnamed protein product [Haemonchus contortus]
MIRPSKILTVAVFMLQVAQSHSCIFIKLCRSVLDATEAIHTTSSNSLYDCLKTCYLMENCNYASLFLVRFSTVFAEI